MKTDDRFYKSKAWKHKRNAILRRDGYMDQIARRYGKQREATIVHHIFPFDAYPEYALKDWNLISVSLASHNKLHNPDGTLSREGEDLLQRTKRKAKSSGWIP